MMHPMKSRTFQFRTPRVGGLPGALLLAVVVIGVLGLLALLLFVGAAVVVGALAVSAGVALWHGLRRKLGQARIPSLFEEPGPTAPPAASSHTLAQVREIEVEVLPKRGH